MDARDRELLAKTLMAEAGNQGVEGMLAAGSVIMNRAQGGGYGQGVEGVIMKPGAFSPWNSVTGFAGGQQGQNMAAIRPTMQAYQIADALLSGQYEDPTGGATHFYNPDISNPSWGTRGGGNWKRIGAHVFGRADDPQWRTAAISTQGAAKGDGAVAANQPRVLTQDDIETYNLTDAVPGDIATPEDIAKMGAGYTLNMPVPPEATQGVSVNQALANDAMDALGKTPSGLRTISVGENPAMPRAGTQPIALDGNMAGGVSDGREVTYAPRPASAAGPVPAGMSGLLQQPISNDPFEGLSKQQRTMLAFAAIADAGAALQGRQGTSFSDTMGAFNEIRDQNRKREAARAEMAARQQMFGALGATPLGPNATPEQIDAYAAKLTSILATNPSMAPYVSAELARINPMRERAAQAQGEIASASRMIDQIDALLYDPALGNALGVEGFFRRPAAELGLDSETARVKERIDQIKGGVFLQAFEALKGGGQITELEGQKAEAAMARLGTSQSLEDYQEALNELRFYIDIGRRRKMGEQIPPDTVYGGGKQDKPDPLGIRG